MMTMRIMMMMTLFSLLYGNRLVGNEGANDNNSKTSDKREKRLVSHAIVCYRPYRR